MPVLSLSTTQRLFDARELGRHLPVIRQAGFRAVEINDNTAFHHDPELIYETHRSLQDAGLASPSFHLMQRNPLTAAGDIDEAHLSLLRTSMKFGALLHAPNQVLHWFQRYHHPACVTAWETVLTRLLDEAARLGVRLLLETVPHKPANERYPAVAEIHETVLRHPPELLGICLDVNHTNLREDLPAAVELFGDRLVSLHLSDNDGQAEQHWLPGQGVIDFPALFASLKRCSFNGLLVTEVGPWTRGANRPGALQNLYEWMRHLARTGEPHPDLPCRKNFID